MRVDALAASSTSTHVSPEKEKIRAQSGVFTGAAAADAWPSSELVWLSPDAEEPLEEELDAGTVYVVGGLIDRSVAKGTSLRAAAAAPSARDEALRFSEIGKEQLAEDVRYLYRLLQRAKGERAQLTQTIGALRAQLGEPRAHLRDGRPGRTKAEHGPTSTRRGPRVAQSSASHR